MTQDDWQKVLSAPPDSLTDEEKDVLCRNIIVFNVESDTDAAHLRTVFQAAKEVLKYKADQVENLVLELDELAAKQGEEEARYSQEIDNLQQQLILARKSAAFQEQNGEQQERGDDLQLELEHAELRAERLLSELQAREQEQLADKQELERLEGQVAMLESERSQLRRELSALKEDMRESQKASQPPESPSPRKDQREMHQKLLESVRQKNKHISQLLNDLEIIEKENVVLQEKLSSIKAELEEATNNIERTTGEIKSLQHSKEEQKHLIQHLEQLCEALQNQVHELVQQNQDRDSQIDGFERAVDVRLQEWMQLVQDKENELRNLQDKLTHSELHGSFLVNDSETSRVALISQTLQKREEQIEQLQIQLAQATKDVNESSALIETLRSQPTKTNCSTEHTDVNVLKQQIQQAEQQIRFLEDKLQDAELDAHGKSEDITEMIVKLRHYEAGEYGLSEAVSEIKQLKQQQKVRDKHIGELVDTVNNLRTTCDSLEEQNWALRDQLGLPPEEEVNIDGVTAKKRKDQLLLVVQQQHLDRLEEDLVNVRVKNRKLSQQLILLHNQMEGKGQSSKSAAQETKSRSKDQPVNPALFKKIRKLQREEHQWKSERQVLVEENEALRQGLHEVLDSIRMQDGSSEVQLESKGLEQLLQALDSRHVSGWYHPAMRLQAQVNAAEGNNAALREQLRSVRENEASNNGELQKAQLRIAELEHILENRSTDPLPALQSQVTAAPPVSVDATLVLSLPADTSASSIEFINKLNTHLLQVLSDCEREQMHVVRLQSLQQELQQELDSLLMQLGNVSREQVKAQNEWDNEKQILRDQLEALETKLAEADARAMQLTKELEVTASEDSQVQSALRLVNLEAEKAVSDRKASLAVCQALSSREQLKNAKIEWQDTQAVTNKRLEFLLHLKRTSVLQLSELGKQLEQTVPIQRLQVADRKTIEMTAKYSHLLRQHEMVLTEMNNKIKQLEEELRLERENKSNLVASLSDAYRKKLPKCEDAMVDELRSQLLAAETALVQERERASHEEKMLAFARGELTQMQDRCSQLEREVSTLIQSNHESQLRELAAQDRYLLSVPLEEVEKLQAELTSLQQQVSDLHANREKLQELADIANEQVRSLNHFSEANEIQVESLRQTVCELQATSDHAAIIARLNEELYSSQMNEMATRNKANSLQAEILRLQGVCERQESVVCDLQKQLQQHQVASSHKKRMMMDAISELRSRFMGTLPAPLVHLIADALIKQCTESRSLWQQLQQEKHAAFLQAISAEENALLRQQTLELQSVLQAQHSEINCQQVLESWSAKNTELRLKEMKSTRRCKMLEDQVLLTEERLTKQEELLSTLEAHLISIQVLPEKKDEDNQVLHDTPLRQTENKESQTEKFVGAQESPENRQLNKQEPQESQPPQLLELQSQKEENEVTNLKMQLSSLTDEVKSLKEQLIRKEEELAACDNIIIDLRQSVSEREVALQNKYHELEKSLTDRDQTVDDGFTSKNLASKDRADASHKAAFKAALDSLQNIINQKEETISRYQGLLRDVREEDTHIILGLQGQVRSLQADLLAQEQAYTILKSGIRKENVKGNGSNMVRSALDSHLTRTHELEDEVALLSTKLASVTAELQSARLEAQRWSNIAQQRLTALDELAHRLDKQYLLDESWKRQPPEQDTRESSSINHEHKKKSMSELNLSKAVDRVTRNRAQQVQLQLRAEVTELRNKLQQMEEQEAISKREIQRLRDQIPIYSRRIRRQNVEENSSKEEELRKKITELMSQMQEQKECMEKTESENNEKLAQRIKSAENIARWDERKKYQSQLERMKNRLQERMDEIAVLRNKSEKMHVSIHRLEREKAVLEHQVKAIKSREIPESAFQRVQQERDDIFRELKELQSRDVAEKAKVEQADTLWKENAALRKANIALECESLQLKLELEKVQADTPRLQHKLIHLENLIDELHTQRSDTMKRHVVTCAGDPGTPLAQSETEQFRAGDRLDGELHHTPLFKKMQNEITLLKKEKRVLQERCEDLTWQLERAKAHITSLNTRLATEQSGNADTRLLQAELHHKTQLLSKVKVLLERAAFKERALTDQVAHLQAAVVSKSVQEM